MKKNHCTPLLSVIWTIQETAARRCKYYCITRCPFVRYSSSQAERARKNAENELGDESTRINELTISVTNLTGDKRRMEADFLTMHSDLDDALKGRSAAQERADRLQLEVKRLTDELRQEQENYKNADGLRKQLEAEIREITVRLEEAESFAQREGKRLVAKLQARVSIIQTLRWIIFDSIKFLVFLLLFLLLMSSE